MGRCIIIAPLYKGEERENLTPRAGDLLLCADGGYAAAIAAGLQPDMVIGDFDSMPPEQKVECPVKVLPVHKDDTDLLVCIREGRARGYTHFVIAGAMGGRMDHTIAALQCLKDCALLGEEAWLVDGSNLIRVLVPSAYDLTPYLQQNKRFSLLAASAEVEDVCLKGAVWELTHAKLTDRYPVGISNESTGNTSLCFGSGLLYLGICRD